MTSGDLILTERTIAFNNSSKTYHFRNVRKHKGIKRKSSTNYLLQILFGLECAILVERSMILFSSPELGLAEFAYCGKPPYTQIHKVETKYVHIM